MESNFSTIFFFKNIFKKREKNECQKAVTLGGKSLPFHSQHELAGNKQKYFTGSVDRNNTFLK